MRILIADDNDVNLTALAGLLRQADYKVETARDGQEAIDRIREGGVRLVISDWEMPRLSGTDLCRAVRSEDLPGYIYIILLTGHNAPHERVEGLSAGADDFIAKPYDPAELLARVRSGERVLSLETRDVAIFAMAKLAESRDPETGAHLERVRSYSRILAQHLAGMEKFRGEVDGEYIRLIYLTSPLHDIGKVGIPDNVLLKPGRLSDREFEIMKTHAALGAQTLAAAQRMFPGVRFLEMARDIAASHHERFDGSGYPDRLVAEAIPLCGRIVALADVYDALTSKRVYKAAFGHDIAKSMIVAESGTHFDPDIVQAFVHNEARFLAVRDKFQEQHAAAA
ncbi:putative cyclic di-GMP phosphodiesterase [Phycisphaerales bacterium]|nr:putative cyclic di-GMP phosphodiesterase [Phycisphaerales bacterium]